MFTRITDRNKRAKEYLTRNPSHYPIRNAAALLSQKQLIPLLTKLPSVVNAPDDIYADLYQQTLTKFAEHVQGLPSIKTKAFAYYGGFLDLGLERTYMALTSYRKEYPIKGITPERMPPKLALWTYALFTVALFYGIGEIAATYLISATDEKGRHASRWDPFKESMKNFGSHYRFSFEAVNRDNLAAKSAPILARQLMPEAGFNWIASDKEVFEYWLNILQNEPTDAGLFAEFVLPTHSRLINQEALHPSILGDIFPEIFDPDNEAAQSEHLEQNRKAADRLSSDTRDLDVTGLTTADLSELFINWLRNGTGDKSISVNRTDSNVHITSEGLLLLSPEIFEAFVKSNAHLKTNWQEVHKHFVQSGHALGAASRIQIGASSAGRSFNLGGASKTTGQTKGILVDMTLIYNANIVPQAAANLQLSSQVQKAYPAVNQGQAAGNNMSRPSPSKSG